MDVSVRTGSPAGRRGLLGVVLGLTATAALVVGSLGGPATPTSAEAARRTAATVTFSRTAIGTPPAGTPIVGRFTDDELDDLLFYEPGPGAEMWWQACPGCGGGPFTVRTAAQQVAGAYDPLVGDFAGDGHDDIFWWRSPQVGDGSEGPDYLWTSQGDGTFRSTRLDMAPGGWRPIVLPDSATGTGKDDVLWRAAHRSSPLWVFPDDGSGAARTAARLQVPPGRELVGDFDGNGAADIFFYATCDFMRCDDPGAPLDAYWRRSSSASPGFSTSVRDVKGDYVPYVGQFSPTGTRDDIIWLGRVQEYRGGRDGPDHLWQGNADGSFSSRDVTASKPVGYPLGHAGGDRLVAPLGGASPERTLWRYTAAGPRVDVTDLAVQPEDWLVRGRFTGADAQDLLDLGPFDPVLLHPTS